MKVRLSLIDRSDTWALETDIGDGFIGGRRILPLENATMVVAEMMRSAMACTVTIETEEAA